MQNISNLLKDLECRKSELQTMAELISLASGVAVAEKDIQINLNKGFRRLRLNISGLKRSILVQKKDFIQDKLAPFNITLVL